MAQREVDLKFMILHLARLSFDSAWWVGLSKEGVSVRMSGRLEVWVVLVVPEGADPAVPTFRDVVVNPEAQVVKPSRS